MADTDPSSEDLENTETDALTSGVSSSASGGSSEGDTSLEETNDNSPNQQPPVPQPTKKDKLLTRVRQSVNIYLLLLGAILLMAVTIILIAYEQSKHSATNSVIKTQNLSQSTLNQLADTNSTVGSNQYILKVESSAIFAGQVVLRQNLEVAGNIQVGGSSVFNNISAAGTAQFSQVTVTNNQTVGGNSAVQGSETIAKALQVNGSGTFGGALAAPQITATTLQLNGDLVLEHHIRTNGSTPTRSNGSALGNGGSSSISGTDTAGSISINVGSSSGAGCFLTINFSAPFTSTPHVLITPVGSAAGGLSYYVNRSTTGFSICDASAPVSGSSFGFDYFIIN